MSERALSLGRRRQSRSHHCILLRLFLLDCIVSLLPLLLWQMKRTKRSQDIIHRKIVSRFNSQGQYSHSVHVKRADDGYGSSEVPLCSF